MRPTNIESVQDDIKLACQFARYAQDHVDFHVEEFILEFTFNMESLNVWNHMEFMY